MKTKAALILYIAAIIILYCGNPLIAYSGGTGEPNDPYQIASKADLLALAADTNDYSKCFILTADVNMEGQVFTKAIIAPDTSSSGGFQGTAFTGTFDGNDYKVTNFTINGGSNFYLGLFGQINSGGSVKNIGLENCTISSYNYSGYVGSLVGKNSGSIDNCYSTGTLNGMNVNVGGLAGYNDGIISNCYATGSISSFVDVGGLVGVNSGGSIRNCYATGSVRASCAGGLVGRNSSNLNTVSGSINNCYSTGSISCSTIYGSTSMGGLVGWNQQCSISNCYSMSAVSGDSNVGGLVGGNSGSISNCYSGGAVSGTSKFGGLVGDNNGNVIRSFWDKQTSGQSTSAGGEGKTTAELQDVNTFLSEGWDFINEKDNGICNYWQMTQGGGYPVLSTFNGYIPPEPLGSGTEEDPYIIVDANDLGTVWFRPLAYYKLVNNINLAGIEWSMAMIPVFSGVFDGNGFCIRNLYINGGSYLGLFGYFYGSVKNLGLENYLASGSSNSYCVGGLVGYNKGGSITICYSTGAGSGSSNSQCIGGLVGYSNSGSITNCYSCGTINGSSTVGGLVGYKTGSINNCYSTVNVSGSSFVGGLVGGNGAGSIRNSFWDTETSNQTIGTGYGSSYGITGLSTLQMKQQASFTGWDFTTIWAICEGTNYPRLLWQIPAADWVCPDGVNTEDLGYFAGRWLESDCDTSNNCGGTDIDVSHTVDFVDFALFASYWLND